MRFSILTGTMMAHHCQRANQTGYRANNLKLRYPMLEGKNLEPSSCTRNTMSHFDDAMFIARALAVPAYTSKIAIGTT